jgi:hypothetical protein
MERRAVTENLFRHVIPESSQGDTIKCSVITLHERNGRSEPIIQEVHPPPSSQVEAKLRKFHNPSPSPRSFLSPAEALTAP